MSTKPNPNRTRASRRTGGKPPHRKPEAGIDLTTAAEPSSPPLPHERDEGVGMTDGVPSERMRQGLGDLKRGVQDTSRAPEADRAYRKLRE
ncbi:MAG: hypothetical protein V4540_00270 [Pseudomonadota bacterium]